MFPVLISQLQFTKASQPASLRPAINPTQTQYQKPPTALNPTQTN
jgi:hypothetical protein